MKSILFSLLSLTLTVQISAQWIAVPELSNSNGQVLLQKGTDLYLGTDGNGIWKSTDGGLSWTESNNGLSSATDYSITDLAAMNDILVAATYDNGIFMSTDEGANWQSITGTLPASTTYPVTAIGTNDFLIYVGVESSGMYATSDTGSTWEALNTGLDNMFFRDILITPSATVYTCTQDGVYTLTIPNTSWSNVSNGLPDSSASCILQYNDVLYLGTRNTGIYHSIDHAATWISLNIPDTETIQINGIYELGGTLYLASTSGLYSTHTGAISWTLFSTGLTTQYPNDVLATNERVIAATGYDGAYYYNLIIRDGLNANASDASIHIYPNPVSDQLSVKSDQIIEDIELCSISGARLKTLSGVHANNTTLSMNNLTEGVYIITIRTGQSVYSQKVLKD